MSILYSNYNTMAFSSQAKNIIDTHATINDKISVIYARESNGCEYKKLMLTNINFLNLIELNLENTLFIVCSKEDNDENILFILYKYKIINGKYEHISNTMII